jgi:hypothetical protein
MIHILLNTVWIGLNIVRIWSRFVAFGSVYWTAMDDSEAAVLPGKNDSVPYGTVGSM